MVDDIGGRSRHWPRRLILGLALGVLCTAPASAAMRQVPDQYATVRAAAAAAASGDTILIAPGTRSGGVFVSNKSLVFASHYILAGDTSLVAQTVINGVASGTCSGMSGCTGTSVLEFGTNAHGSKVIGLTISGGENGISATSIVDVSRCRIIANGDGVDYYAGAGGILEHSLFADNTDDGIDLNGRMNVTIRDNIVRNNRDDGIEFRLYSFAGPPVLVEILRNTITGNGEDGIQLIDYPEVNGYVIRIERNVFSANYDVSGSSAAIGVMPNGETVENLVGAPMAERVYVVNNTFINEKNGLVGGANVIALNNVFTGTAGKAVRRVGGSSVTSYTIFWNNLVNHEESVVDAPNLHVVDPALGPTGIPAAGSPAIDAGTAFFQWGGQTVLDLPPGSYIGAAPDIGAVEFGSGSAPPNAPPTVNAGPDQAVTLLSGAALDGTVSDDGFPYPPGLLSTHWNVVSGAGPMAFQAPDQVDTRAAFSQPGVYTLRLVADDGAIAVADSVRITVLTGPNTPPTVDAGPNRSITLPASASLDGTVNDEGLPNPPGAVAATWTKSSGPGGVTFADSNAVDTQASFTVAGTYVLRLTANDGELAAADSMEVTVAPPVPIERRIVAASDDAEEGASGAISANISDLELVFDATNQTVGLRFTNLTVPQGATIANAWIQFEADEVQSEPTNLVLQGQAADNAGTFTTTAFDISSRPRTAAAVNWSPAPWTLVGEAGPNQRTPDLKSVIQQVVSRPGWASGNALAIIITGTGHRTARSYEGLAPGAALLHIELSASGPPANVAPTVDAGPDRSVVLPGDAVLDGTVFDDRLPNPPGFVTTTWSQVSGPGPAEFQDPGMVDTPVTFTVAGTYILRLAADDGALVAADTMEFVVYPVPNAPPSVDAGPNRSITLPATASLDGTVGDDGLPNPPGTVTTVWSKVSGPGNVTFGDSNAVDTQASFTTAGTYVLRLTADDGALAASDSMQVTVAPPAPPIDRRIAASSDDAEEGSSGFPNLASADLELVFDTSLQTVGLRFTNVTVPPGATIANAWIQFEADETQSEATNLVLKGQAADNPGTFTSSSLNVSSRPRTTAAVNWSPVPWTLVGEAGPNQRTPNLSSVIQEIVNRPGWASGNALAIIITGTGHRTARAYDGLPGSAPLLHIELGAPPPTNVAPTVDAGPNRSITLPATAALDGTVSDDGLPNPPAAVTTMWSKVSGPGNVTFGNANSVDTQASFTTAGTYVLRLTANDGVLAANDTMTVTVAPVPNAAPTVDAGPNRSITLPATASLDGTVNDDGLPNPPGIVTTGWSKVSGPGSVSFADSNAVDTQASFTTAGTYVLRLTANDGALTANDTMTVFVTPVPNAPPTVDAGPDRSITLPATASLDGTVNDDGLPNPPGVVTTVWSKVSGPGNVSFADSNAVDTQASFTTAGTYVLRLTGNDGALAANDTMTVTVAPVPNVAPTVDAGPNRSITLPATASLDGTVSDDGLPNPPGMVTTTWSKVSGPGNVAFADSNAVDTQASFTTAGTYVLRLTANDGALSANDLMQVTVAPDPNTPPVVNAGPDQTIVLPAMASLDGTVNDDGLPAPPALSPTWSKVSGPGNVTFTNPNAVDTQASFTAAGIYVLRLTVSDGQLNGSDEVQITAQAVAPPLERRVAASSDDAEESSSGVMNLTSTNLDLVFNASNQTVGLRFTGVTIPTGATVTTAWIQFTARKVDQQSASLTLQGQAADNPGTFTGASGNVSGRALTTASVSWSPPAWTRAGDAGAEQRTPELKTIVQEVVSRPGWASANAMVFVVTGTGTRVASSWDAAASEAALLHVEYAVAGEPLTIARDAPLLEGEDGLAEGAAAEPVAPVVPTAPVSPASPRDPLRFALHRVTAGASSDRILIEFELAAEGAATLEVLDVSGRRAALADAGRMGPGRHRLEVRGRLPIGVYLVRLRQGPLARVRKVAIVR